MNCQIFFLMKDSRLHQPTLGITTRWLPFQIQLFIYIWLNIIRLQNSNRNLRFKIYIIMKCDTTYNMCRLVTQVILGRFRTPWFRSNQKCLLKKINNATQNYQNKNCVSCRDVHSSAFLGKKTNILKGEKRKKTGELAYVGCYNSRR